ncbi:MULTISPECIES: V-type ATP synthase subunit I [unclassified Granulicatella]|uniref:V-type ATP synthase subunit I n=1 Tax=unclassified Granulicatella TaxID=2630493 RepID=UPI0010746AE5|nr:MULTISPECIES: V-type ATP synthase subunit I [unclassified Granulicatella]MBF0780213.1 V-type ATP synthase subunit I [Granulicatella sp. 19428wC4_WM01]TFU95706.1 V-type ATP synthase subunit I [Granulicatella sp. WM01]
MAVTKMQKWIILVEEHYKNKLLETIQESQSFEPIQEDVSIDQLKQEETTILQDVHAKEQLLKEVLSMQDVLKPYVSKKQLKQRYALTVIEIQEKLIELNERNVFVRVRDIVKEKKQLQKQLEKLLEHVQLLKRWKSLPILPTTSKALRAVQTFVGTFPQSKHDERYQELAQHDTLLIDELFSDELERGVIIYCDKKDKDSVEQMLSTLHFTPFHYPFPQLPHLALKALEQEIQQIYHQKQTLNKELEHLAHYYSDLLFKEEQIANEIERLQAQLFMLNGQSLSAVVGWMAQDKEKYLKELLHMSLPQSTFVCVKDESVIIDEKDIPIVLNNHPLIEPFELLTEMYSLPKYSEVDPTPLLAPFYAAFFGMMVADIGYGLLLLFGTWYALRKMPLSKQTRKNVRLFHLLAYPSILWGIFFGSFFSIELPFKVLSTSTDAISILAISVVFGVIQLMFGLAVNTHIQLKSRQYATAFSDGLGWLGIFIGLIGIVLETFLHTGWLGTMAQYVIIVHVGVIVLSSVLGAKNKLAGLGSGLYKLYGASSYIGDLASYTRLMALCVAGASIGSSFNLIIGLLPPIAKFTIGIVLFIVLQTLNLALALLGAYVHGIRLQFVEFFGKFYEGGGRKMKPLKTYEKYIDLKERHLEEK